ncbi:AraC family transcriptional regulator [Caballeronia calidae]|uniref:AraC family transcriptional regulator n=1 Tax=Caballeronia calidae TaxID=1777139 RepID=A0A158EH87_9BURK|nr:AraC family transcriptional regulator [Caballeronia calidae]SAL06198.1 AraC family transcriptional regulator [Caballeronia calidae]
MSSLVRAACLTNYSEVARACALDPVRMLLDAALSPSVLNNPDVMIPVERVGQLLQDSARLSGIESFGLRMAETRLLSNLGAVGLLVRDQPTLRESLGMLMRYQPVLNDALSLTVEEYDGLVTVREAVRAGNAHQSTRQRIELALGVMVRLIRQLIRPDWRPRRVCLEHAPPRDVGTHLRFFGPCVEFDCDFNAIIFSKADLDARNPLADVAMARYAQQLVDASNRPHATTLEAVQRTILQLLPGGRCSIEQVAEHMGMVCRTVQRRLAEQGHSFSTILNDVRRELTTRHVIEGDRPLTEVAALLGFASPSAFSRWYHTQFGCSAKESRAQRGAVRWL